MTRRFGKALAPLAFALVLSPALPAERLPVEVSSDFDAEFARAADLLEEGRRSDAEAVLEAVVRKSGQPAWSARAALLLASDDARRKNWAAAAGRLAATDAAPIGLEPYRNLFRAESLELAGREAEALAPARRAFEAEGSFAWRVRAGSLLARLEERQRERAEAAEILALASLTASNSEESAQIAIDRIRQGLAFGDRAEVKAAARDLLLQAPGFDALPSTPDFARRAAAEAEKSLTPAERARRGRALVGSGDARRGVALLSRDRPEAWPEGERGASLLALARGQLALKKTKAAEATAARVPNDGTQSAYEARLFRCDLVVARLRGHDAAALSPLDPRLEPVKQTLEALTAPASPASVRRGARQRLLRFAADAEDFDTALALACALNDENAGGLGFEPLWQLAWRRYRAGDYSGARTDFEKLAPLYRDVTSSRRQAYWKARCLAAEGRASEARAIFAELAAAAPPDLYARFARARVGISPRLERPAVRDPSTATATFARVDELLRLRMFEAAASEARRLLPSRGRELRIAQADFALGRFPTAAASIKSALPQIGTAEEGRVPDGWRRLYYPIEEGSFLPERAREFGLDPAVLRGLVRQESVFDATAKSRAGAMGLMQLMPSTAKSLSRSVLRARYRRAFLYDPGVNARLGAAYFQQLLERFDHSTILALAAYNGGPTRIARLLRENPSLPEDELFESIPMAETRDYVRRVMLYAESYRELYP